jgi:hypothetical protein
MMSITWAPQLRRESGGVLFNSKLRGKIAGHAAAPRITSSSIVANYSRYSSHYTMDHTAGPSDVVSREAVAMAYPATPPRSASGLGDADASAPGQGQAPAATITSAAANDDDRNTNGEGDRKDHVDGGVDVLPTTVTGAKVV